MINRWINNTHKDQQSNQCLMITPVNKRINDTVKDQHILCNKWDITCVIIKTMLIVIITLTNGHDLTHYYLTSCGHRW